MDVIINTDHSVEANDRMITFFKEEIMEELKNFSNLITRTEVHLTDENGPKANLDDIQCKIETRLRGKQPLVVSAKGANLEKAISSATSKMKSVLTTKVGKLQNH